MKHIVCHHIVWGIAFLLAAITVSAAPRAESPEQLKAQIRKVLVEQVAAWNRGDINAFMQGYWNSPDLLFTSAGNVRRGWKTTLQKYQATYPNKERMGELSFSDLEIHLLPSPDGDQSSANAAWVFGKWHLKRAGDEPHGVFTLILQRFAAGGHTTEGGWKIVHDHTSSSQ